MKVNLVSCLTLVLALGLAGCGANSNNSGQKVKAVALIIDAQDTFFDRPGEAGSLAITGSRAVIPNIEKVAVAARKSDKVKTVESADHHSMKETYHIDGNIPPVGAVVASVLPPVDFGSSPGAPGTHVSWGVRIIPHNSSSAPTSPDVWKVFTPHGLADVTTGPTGSQRIREIRDLYTRQVFVDHHVFDGGEMRLVRDSEIQLSDKSILDTDEELVIRKNGHKSTDVWSNPRTARIFKLLSESGSIPVLVSGVAEDICVWDAIQGLINHGWDLSKIYVIADAVKSLTPSAGNAQRTAFQAQGVKYISTDEALQMISAL